jgi:hypothetical protein
MRATDFSPSGSLQRYEAMTSAAMLPSYPRLSTQGARVDVKTYVYNNDFMQYAAQSSAYSAAVITSILYRQLEVDSVLDVECARDTWLRAWGNRGVVELHGVDGSYVNRRALEVPARMFTAVDFE